MATVRKLDMNHAFFKQVKDNQIDRDQFDKAVKAKKEPIVTRTKKPNLQTYSVPQRSKVPAKDNVANNADIVFKLEYEDENGLIHEVMIRRSKDILLTVKEFGASINMKSPLITALYNKVLDEYNRLMS